LDCYIVRIYRKQENDPHALVGLLEEVGTQEKSAFSSIDELCELLAQGEKKIKTKDGMETRRSEEKATQD
jgi:hypothetical protein